MKKFKGTKGDWEFSKSRGVIFSEDCDYIADVCGTNATSEEETANAKLIAAAPDLLKSLSRLLSACNGISGEHVVGLMDLDNASVIAEAAIKKALGEDK